MAARATAARYATPKARAASYTTTRGTARLARLDGSLWLAEVTEAGVHHRPLGEL